MDAGWIHVILAYGAMFIFFFGVWAGRVGRPAEVWVYTKNGELQTINVSPDVKIEFTDILQKQDYEIAEDPINSVIYYFRKGVQ